MSACKALVRISLSSLQFKMQSNSKRFSSISLATPCAVSASSASLLFVSRNRGFDCMRVSSRFYAGVHGAVSFEAGDCMDGTFPCNSSSEPSEDLEKDTVEELLSSRGDIGRLMKMERRLDIDNATQLDNQVRWFPYLDKFKSGSVFISSSEIIEALDPYILEERKERIRKVVKNRSYALCLVVEGLSDFGNASASFRSADALGFQSVHVVSCDGSKRDISHSLDQDSISNGQHLISRYRDNRHVSMGAEKWLDIELWNSTQECFKVLKSRGYRIATTHVGMNAVSIYDMDWTCPTAIVVGNENRGISDEALELSDLCCSIPMRGMVDSFNVSVAAGILMHHAVCDRTSHLGCHGDLTQEESRILLAEFSLRHSKSASSIVHEYAKRKTGRPMPKL